MAKTYVIELSDSLYVRKFLKELSAWGVDEGKYEVLGNMVKTQDKNVVDVATETFMFHTDVLTITDY